MRAIANGEGVVCLNDTDGVTRHKLGDQELCPGIAGPVTASAAALVPPNGASRFHVSGTVTITSITATNLAAGTLLVLVFDGALTFTNGGTLKLVDDFVTTGSGTEVIGLLYDGTNFLEVFRAE